MPNFRNTSTLTRILVGIVVVVLLLALSGAFTTR